MPVKKRRSPLIDSVAPQIQTRKARFLRQMETLVDWDALGAAMAEGYSSRVRMADAAGRPASPPILLLKMLLPEAWYGMRESNREYLRARGLRDGIMRRKPREGEMRASARRRNRLISRVRGRVELAFAGFKRWCKSGQGRYVGLDRTRGQRALEAMALNLFLAPGKSLRDALG